MGALDDILKNGFGSWEEDKKKVGSFEELPEGTYPAIISKVQHTVIGKNGWDPVSVQFEVIEGDHIGKKESIRLSFNKMTKKGTPMPSFVLERGAVTVLRLAAFAGHPIELDKEENAPVDEALFNGKTFWEFFDHENLTEFLQETVGATVLVIKEITENKTNPDRPNSEYGFNQYDAMDDVDPFATDGKKTDFDENDLPFADENGVL